MDELRAAMSKLPSLLAIPATELRQPLMLEVREYLKNALEAAIRAWVVATRAAGNDVSGDDGRAESTIFEDRAAIREAFERAEAAADVALAFATFGGTELPSMDSASTDLGRRPPPSALSGLAALDALVRTESPASGTPSLNKANAPLAAFDALPSLSSSAGASPRPNAATPAVKPRSRLAAWHALCRDLPSTRITSLSRHEFFQDYLRDYAARVVDELRASQALGDDVIDSSGARATAGHEDAARLARPAALASLLGALPSAVRRESAAAMVQLQSDADFARAPEKWRQAVEEALRFAQ